MTRGDQQQSGRQEDVVREMLETVMLMSRSAAREESSDGEPLSPITDSIPVGMSIWLGQSICINE